MTDKRIGDTGPLGRGRTAPLGRPGSASAGTATTPLGTGPSPRIGGASSIAGSSGIRSGGVGIPGAGVPTARPRLAEAPAGVSAVLVLCRWLMQLVLGAWIGGEMTLGMLVATRALEVFKTRAATGSFLGPLFVKLTIGGAAAGLIYLILMLVHDGLWVRYHETTTARLLALVKLALAAGMVGAAGYLYFRVGHQMDGYQHAARVVNGVLAGGAGRAFDYWHKLFRQITFAMLGAAAALMLLTQISRKRR